MTYRITMVSGKRFDITAPTDMKDFLDRTFGLKTKYENHIAIWREDDGRTIAICSKYVESIIQIN